MASQSLIDAAEWTMNATFFASVFFPAVTSFYWPWWKTSWGRNIVALDLAIAVTIFPNFLEIDFRVESTVLTWVQVIALSLIVLLLAWRTVMIWRTQRNGASEKP